MARSSRLLVIVADSIEGQALAALVANVVRGTMKIVAVKAPYYGEQRREFLKDLCLVTGANLVSMEDGKSLRDVRLDFLGTATSSDVSKYASTIIGGDGRLEDIESKIELLKQELKQSGFAEDEPSFIQRMRKIKKQGFYFSQGEIDPNVSGLAVPVRFSNKEVPLALTLVASKNRFDFLNVEKLIEILQENAALIEQRFMELSEKGEI